jgi:tetratricopeptide (TPR) repeat protein
MLESVIQWFASGDNAHSDKHLLEFLDLTVVRMDLRATLGRQCDCSVLTNVGEALEAIDQYSQAAELYRYAAENFTCPDRRWRWKIYTFAGVAYRRCGEPEQAEKMYVEALRLYELEGLPFRFDDIDFRNLCQNIKNAYSDMRFKTAQYTKVTVLLDCLLSAGGFFEAAHQPETSGLAAAFLKPEFQGKRGSLKVLCLASKIGTVAGFQAKILGCARRDAMWHRLMARDPIERGSRKECTLDVLRQDNATANMVRCFNPACGKIEENTTEGKFMRCPCRTAYYCSRECQVSRASSRRLLGLTAANLSHVRRSLTLKVHKKMCPYIIAKKKLAAS